MSFDDQHKDLDHRLESDTDVVVPLVEERVDVGAAAVQTGGVRVVKRVQTHEEVFEQQLRKGRAEVKHVKVDRVVGGPQQPRRVGNTLVIPVVSEVLRVTKEWVLTEEIHVTQIDERQTVETRVNVNREIAEVQRLDASGEVRRHEPSPSSLPDTPPVIQETSESDGPKRVLTNTPSLLRHRSDQEI